MGTGLSASERPAPEADFGQRGVYSAAIWRTDFLGASHTGHLNAATGLGWLREGQEFLDRVIRAAAGARAVSGAPTILEVSATNAASARGLLR